MFIGPKNWMNNSPSKNDSKDVKTIAMLVTDGLYREVYIPDDIYQELREGGGRNGSDCRS
jgi:RNase adaptor protein for sRNA GlmZ degradation